MRLLIVAPRPTSQALAGELESRGFEGEIVSVDNGAQAALTARQAPFDLILLADISRFAKGVVPGELKELRDAAPQTALIVVLESGDQARALEMIAAGASECLARAGLRPEILRWVVTHTAERMRLEREIELSKSQAAMLEREADDYRRLYFSAVSSAVTAESFGVAPLKDGFKEKFRELVAAYSAALDLASAERAHLARSSSYKSGAVVERLGRLTDELAFLQAGARDVVDIHTAAMREKELTVATMDETVFIEEGRFLLLQVMGGLLNVYRRYAIPFAGKGAPKPRGPAGTGEQ